LSFPVLFDINQGSERVRFLVEFLKEGFFLDQFATTHLTLYLATFNLDTQLYGYVRIDAEWLDSGLIHAKWDLQALEHRDYTPEGLQMDGMANRLGNDMVSRAWMAGAAGSLSSGSEC